MFERYSWNVPFLHCINRLAKTFCLSNIVRRFLSNRWNCFPFDGLYNFSLELLYYFTINVHSNYTIFFSSVLEVVFSNLFFFWQIKQKCQSFLELLLLFCRFLQRNLWLRRRGRLLCLSTNWWSRGLFLHWTSVTTLLRASPSTKVGSAYSLLRPPIHTYGPGVLLRVAVDWY